MKLTVILLLFTCLFFTNCKQLPANYATRHSWKFGGGFGIGDWVEFNHSCELRHDTIYMNKVPVARIKAMNRGTMPGDDNEMVIQSLTSDSTGVYHEK